MEDHLQNQGIAMSPTYKTSERLLSIVPYEMAVMPLNHRHTRSGKLRNRQRGQSSAD